MSSRPRPIRPSCLGYSGDLTFTTRYAKPCSNSYTSLEVAMPSPSPSRITFVLLAAAVCVLLALPALADSQARIVRLSDVQGSVQIDKNTGLGFEDAFLNLPITQGTQLRTGDRGRAEMEFEDGSSMRLTPNTTVQFSKLGSMTRASASPRSTSCRAWRTSTGWARTMSRLNFSHETRLGKPLCPLPRRYLLPGCRSRSL